jgi:hypothetical protein
MIDAVSMRGSTWRTTPRLARAVNIPMAMYGAIGITRATATSRSVTIPMNRPADPFPLFFLVLPIDRLNGCQLRIKGSP